MSSKILFIYNSIKLFEILNEIKQNLNFETFHIDKNEYKKVDFKKFENYLIITTKSSENFENSLLINSFLFS